MIDKESLIKEYRIHPNDTGSVEVQIAVLTERIRNLDEHFKKHKKDHHNKRRYLMLINKRRRFLEYLKRKKPQSYLKIAKSLGLI